MRPKHAPAHHERAPRPECLRVSSEAVSGMLVVHLHGELDASGVGRVDEELAMATREVVVDLADLSFIDAAGIACLISAKCRRDRAGGSLVLRGARRPVQRVFELLALEELLEPAAARPRHSPPAPTRVCCAGGSPPNDGAA